MLVVVFSLPLLTMPAGLAGGGAEPLALKCREAHLASICSSPETHLTSIYTTPTQSIQTASVLYKSLSVIPNNRLLFFYMFFFGKLLKSSVPASCLLPLATCSVKFFCLKKPFLQINNLVELPCEARRLIFMLTIVREFPNTCI